MSFVDNGEEELDYGEEEALAGENGVTLSAQAEEEINPEEEEEEEEEGDYEDLYDDVNIIGSYFGEGEEEEASSVPISVPVPAEAIADSVQALREEANHNKGEGMGEGEREREREPEGEREGDGILPPTERIERQTWMEPTEGGVVVALDSHGDNTAMHGCDNRFTTMTEGLLEHLKKNGEEEPTGLLGGGEKKPSSSSSSSPPSMRGNGGRGGGGGGYSTTDNAERNGNSEATPEVAVVASSGGGVLGVGESKVLGSSEGGKVGSNGVVRSARSDYTTRYGGEDKGGDKGGENAMLFVGELNWWTTDAEIEAALAEYGKVKGIRFFEERASGKSKGYCQVEFSDRASASLCKDGMNGRVLNGRACVVAFANPRTIHQMASSQLNKAQPPPPPPHQSPAQPRRAPIDGGSRIGNKSGYGIGGGQGMGSRGGGGNGNKSRNNMGYKGGNGVGRGPPYNQHLGAHHMNGHPAGIMMHQGMMGGGQGYESIYMPAAHMGRGGGGYGGGGYMMPGAPFSAMVPPPFSNMGPGVLPGVAPHVNPAFFGRSPAIGGVPGGGVMQSAEGGGGSHPGMWGESAWGGVGESSDRVSREASYGDDGDYGYGNEMAHEKSMAGRDRGDGDWIERRRRDDREEDWERDRNWDRDGHWERERGRENDRDKERSIRGPRNKQWSVEDDDDDGDQQHPWPRGGEENRKRFRMAPGRDVACLGNSMKKSWGK